jgi:radical SAM protein with 4Fe4S-binding SPASM domain
MKQANCELPWSQLIIGADGIVTPCSFYSGFGSSRAPLGNVNEKSIMEIWNDKPLQYLREFLLSEEGKSGCPGCFALTQGRHCEIPFIQQSILERHAPDYRSSPAWQNYQLAQAEIVERKISLQAKPGTISLSPSYECNFRCVMCYQRTQRDLKLTHLDKIGEELLEILPFMSTIIAGGGEPLIQPFWKKLTAGFSKEQNPILQFALTTNGMLMDEAALMKLRTYPFLLINVSFDSPNAAVFEKIRINSKFDTIKANLLHALRSPESLSGKWYVSANMTVMRSNFHLLPDMVRFMKEHQIRIGYSPCNYYPYAESILTYLSIHEDLIKQIAALDEATSILLTDPGLKELRAFAGHLKTIRDLLPLHLLERPQYTIPLKMPSPISGWVFSLITNGPSLYFTYEGIGNLVFEVRRNAEEEFALKAVPGVYQAITSSVFSLTIFVALDGQAAFRTGFNFANIISRLPQRLRRTLRPIKKLFPKQPPLSSAASTTEGKE